VNDGGRRHAACPGATSADAVISNRAESDSMDACAGSRIGEAPVIVAADGTSSTKAFNNRSGSVSAARSTDVLPWTSGILSRYHGASNSSRSESLLCDGGRRVDAEAGATAADAMSTRAESNSMDATTG
jgi:hypothetical protein